MEGLIPKGLVGGMSEVLAWPVYGTITTPTGVVVFLGVAVAAAAAGIVFLLFAVAVVAPMVPARRIFLLPCHLFFTQLAVRPGSWSDILDHLFE